MTIIAQTPNAIELTTAQSQSSTIAGSAQNTVTSNQFVYFAGFDGTNIPLIDIFIA